MRAVRIVCALLNGASLVRLSVRALRWVSLLLDLSFGLSGGRRAPRRDSIVIVLPQYNRIVWLRHSIESTYRFIKRVPTVISTSSFSATMNGPRYVLFPKRIRKTISPSNRSGLPLASPSVGSTASFVRNVSHPSVSDAHSGARIEHIVKREHRSFVQSDRAKNYVMRRSAHTTQFLNVGRS